MAGFTNYLEAKLLDHIFTDATYTPPTTLYVALFTGTLTGDVTTGLTEVSGSNYARVATTAADWSAAALAEPSTKTNTAVLTFPTASGSWGTISYFGIYDASTVGNALIVDALTATKVIGSGDTFSFPASSLIIKLGDPGDTY